VVPVVVPEYTAPVAIHIVDVVEPDVVANTTIDPFKTDANVTDANVTVILGANWSHYFIFATAIFGLFWGVV